MLYNKHELLSRDDPKVRQSIPGLENGKTYWVYSYLVVKRKRGYEVSYDVSPKEVTAKVIDNICYVISTHNGHRFSMFSAYCRQLYFADTPEEAQRSYSRLVNKINKEFDIIS